MAPLEVARALRVTSFVSKKNTTRGTHGSRRSSRARRGITAGFRASIGVGADDFTAGAGREGLVDGILDGLSPDAGSHSVAQRKEGCRVVWQRVDRALEEPDRA